MPRNDTMSALLNVQNVGTGIALFLFGWYFIGLWLNRQRAARLIAAVRAAVPATGGRPGIRWYGRAAFQVDLTEPQAPLTALRILCLLEPRDFALAWVWNRLRGRRDTIIIQADFERAPRSAARPDPTGYSVAGLDGVELQTKPPHLKLTLQCGVGQEAAIGQSVELVQQLAVQQA